MKIIIAEPEDFSSEALAALSAFAEVECRSITTDEIPFALNTYDVFWFRLGFKLSSDIIAKSEKCRFIISPVTGLDHIDLDACQRKNITVISLKDQIDFLKKVRATAEHTLALTLALLRNIPAAANDTKSGNWNRKPFKGTEIFDKTVGILGFGRLGSITAVYFKAMGAKVIAYDIKPYDTSVCESVKTMNDLFMQSDIISVHVNLHKETKHLVGKEQFDLMKKCSFFINTSRGQIVDSEALIEALKNKTISGAAVDVIEQEFNPEKDLLLQYTKECDNLIVTPHIGGNTWESFAKTELFMVEQLKNKM
jgi:D-3-phosphoglycerate dehydrogenase